MQLTPLVVTVAELLVILYRVILNGRVIPYAPSSTDLLTEAAQIDVPLIILILDKLLHKPAEQLI